MRNLAVRALAPALVAMTLVACSSSSPSGSGSPSALTGEVWRLDDASSSTLVSSVPAGVAVTIEFADAQASGNSGCNAYGGDYTAKDDGSISFGAIRMTAMACPEAQMALESAYLKALGSVTTFSVGDSLTLSGGAHELTFSKETSPAPLALIGTDWTLSSMTSAGTVSSATAGTPQTLKLATDGTASGSASCNNYHGTYAQQGSSLTFGPLATTMMHCGDAVMTQEHAFLTAMANVKGYAIEGSQLTLTSAGGATLLTFVGPSA